MEKESPSSTSPDATHIVQGKSIYELLIVSAAAY